MYMNVKLKEFLFWVIIIMIIASVVIKATPTTEDDKMFLPAIEYVKEKITEVYGLF